MTDHPPDFFQGTEMPTAGWWEALWPDPAGVLTRVGLRSGIDVIDLCSGDGWFVANAFPDQARLAGAVRAALKSNGWFAVVNWHKRPRDETPIIGEPRS